MPTSGSPSGRRRSKAASDTAKTSTANKAAAKKSTTKKATKKPSAKKTPVEKTAVKKAAASGSKKPTAKKASAKKVTKKPTAKKASAKKVTKKSTAKKAAKKSTAKKAPAKKVTKKSTAKKAPAKKAAARGSKKSSKKRSAEHKPTTITRRVSRKRPNRRSKSAKPLIGWREWVVLPEFTDTPIKAKVDSGAVTSSLHAFNLQISTDGGQTTARFGVAPKQGSHAAKTIVEHPVVAFKKVRSSNGQAELRPVIRTLAVIGEEEFEIDITLASRDAMGFRMLLGRRAVRNRFVIDPGRSFLQPTTPDAVPPTDQ